MNHKTAFILKYRKKFKPPCEMQSEEAIHEFTKSFYDLNIADTLYIENIEKLDNRNVESETEAITLMTAIIRGDRFNQGLIQSCIHSGKIYNLLLLFETEEEK